MKFGCMQLVALMFLVLFVPATFMAFHGPMKVLFAVGLVLVVRSKLNQSRERKSK